MRCPYCGGLNAENASFCAQCGRDLLPVQVREQPVQPQRQPQQQSPFLPAHRPTPPTHDATRTQPSPPPQRPYQLPRPVQQPVVVPRQVPVQTPLPVPPPSLPQQIVEAPAHFPPRNVQQLKALQAEAMPYTVINETVATGRKKIIRIVYRHCAAWQQVATLLQAFSEQKQTEPFNTIIVQGVLEQDTTSYSFTNGQLQFDRGVRLGSQTLNRYQIETGNGFESDSVRIVLAE
ncbi:MAG: hypothetical protein NVSMB49_27030 [Ktedonobacteraceae bacterium]